MTGLREGVTTGSCAAAAAKAAARMLLLGHQVEFIEIPCPSGEHAPHAQGTRLTIPIDFVVSENEGVRASVIKDAGDDPDVTHGHAIQALVTRDPAGSSGAVHIDGGVGVGRVTRPGLPAPVGHAAINPAPLGQIEAAVREILEIVETSPALRVLIEVPEGARLAEATLNPRLGITGGISILGTRGTVRPYSHGAWKQTIRQQLAAIQAAGQSTAVLTTGGRSEHLAKKACPHLPDLPFLQIGDFLAFALRQAAKHGMVRIVLGMYFGKCLKLAQGIGYTHARAGALTLKPLHRWCHMAGLESAARTLEDAQTARHAMELLDHSPQGPAVLQMVSARALAWARHMAGCDQNAPLALTLLLFDTKNALRMQRSRQD